MMTLIFRYSCYSCLAVYSFIGVVTVVKGLIY